MKSEKRRTLEDYLIEKVKESGYPLEIEISNLLGKEYVVFNTQYYFDKEIEQGRDIDIHAMPLGFNEMDKRLAPLRLRTDIAVECKKSETHAWVFYTRQNIPVGGYHISGQFKTSVPKPKRYSSDSFQWMLRKCLAFHYCEFKRVAIAYDEIRKKKDGSSRRDIFEATHQLLKFICYEIHQSFIRRSKLTDLPPEDELIFVVFPILVFDGDMFEVTFDSKEPKLERKNHIMLGTHYRCPFCQEVESFTVDIVHRSYFSVFMKILRADFLGLKKMILKNHDELVKRSKETRRKCENEELNHPLTK